MNKHYRKLIIKAENELQDEYNKWMEILFSSAIITLWKRYGWRKKRIIRFVDNMKGVYEECANEPDMSILQILHRDVGLDLRIEDDRSWKDYCVLNAELRKKRTPAEILSMKKAEKKWAHATILAMVLTGLHRKEKWGMKKRIPEFEGFLYETCVDYKYNIPAMKVQVEMLLDEPLEIVVQ